MRMTTMILCIYGSGLLRRGSRSQVSIPERSKVEESVEVYIALMIIVIFAVLKQCGKIQFWICYRDIIYSTNVQ